MTIGAANGEERVVKFGVHVFVTDNGASPVEAAVAAEAAGLDAIYIGDHSHIPAANETIDGLDQLPVFLTCYARFYDQIVALAAMATATEGITVGTGVCLVPLREPLGLAKQIASIDHLSGGRVHIGIGGGWNHQEIANHRVDPKRRFAVMREHVLAMKEIWTKEVADFHGEHVDFSGVMSWPKPVQSPHPPILVGGRGPKVLERVFEYGDGWAPDVEGGPDAIEQLVPRIEEFKRRRTASGRDVMLVLYGTETDAACVRRAEELGFDAVVFNVPPGTSEEVRANITRAGELAHVPL
jgi:probable F420-dependent oxidoreductase